MNNFEKRTYNYIFYSDLEKLIKSILGFDYDIIANHELNNYSFYQCTVVELHDDEIPSDFTELTLCELMDYLCTLGHVPEGDLLVEVLW